MYTVNSAFRQKMRGGAVRQNILIAFILSCLQVFLEPVDVFARSDTSRVKPSKVTNTRVSNSRSSRSRVQRSRASNARVKKRTSSRARKENRARRQNTKLSLEARWKRLPVKQKIKLYHSMVRTMAVLELSRRQRSTKTSSLYLFWQLFIAQAYAQARGTCFFGGHVLSSCKWQEATRDDNRKRCNLNGVGDGIQCNREIFPTAPCVYRVGIYDAGRNYSTTQACAYADAQLIAEQLRDSNSSLDNITLHQKRRVVKNQIRETTLWNSDVSEEWIKKRDKLIEEALDGADDAVTRYNVALLDATDGNILEKLQDVNATCSDVSNSIEKKHCDVFRHDLEALNNVPVADVGADVSEVANDCVKFHQLPGKHFCQVKTGDDQYLVVRLEEVEGNQYHGGKVLKAVVYQSDRSDGDYCLSSNFDTEKVTYKGPTVTLDNFNNFVYLAGSVACFYKGDSHKAVFTHQGQTIEIKKEHGVSNRCLFDGLNEDLRHLENDRTELFFPGIADDGRSNGIYQTALRDYNRIKNQGDNKDKCIETHRVALHEAGLLFNKACGSNISLDVMPRRQTSTDVVPLSSWLSQSKYYSNIYFNKLSIRQGNENISSKLMPIFNLEKCDERNDPLCLKRLTITDYLCGNGNAPSSNGIGCDSRPNSTTTGEAESDWTTGLVEHCSTATSASARGRGSGGSPRPATGGAR